MSITLLLEITRRVAPPRVLSVDRPLGYPLGAPRDAELQKRIILAALDLLPKAVADPLIVEFN